MSILIVDDEADVRDALRHILERAGFQVRCTDDGAQALAEMRRARADLVISDIIMPKVDGVETIHAIREEFPGVRIVAISGGGKIGVGEYEPDAITTSAYLAAAGKFGADEVLTKPFETAELLAVIRHLCGAGLA